VHHDRNFDGGVNAWDGWLGSDFEDDRVERMTNSMLSEGKPMYAVITQQMKVYNDYYGLFPAGAISRFEEQLLANPHWRVLTHTSTLTVVQLELEER
jgi:hypothetical protein